MTIDLAIMPLLNSKYEIDSSSLQLRVINAKIPGAHLEEMKNVLRNLFHTGMNDMLGFFHLPNFISIFKKELLLFKNFFIEELILACIFPE